MHTRALGKALGQRRRRVRQSAVAMPWLVAAAWLVCAGVSVQREAHAEALPEFEKIQQTAERKRRFFAYLTPVIRAENDRIRRQRDRLMKAEAAWRAGERNRHAAFVESLAREYRLPAGGASPRTVMDELLRRVDVIPLSLVLVQAAKESGWGRSRFARQANNLFGQWCYRTGCGLVPRQRPEGMSHEVASFDSVRDSVASYMKNLNTHRSYETLRALRAELRAAERPLSGMRLAEGLTPYSARGDRYVREVQTMIRQNDLEREEVVAAIVGS